MLVMSHSANTFDKKNMARIQIIPLLRKHLWK
jgi:hypothetical protein